MSFNVAMIEAMEAEGLSAGAILRVLKAGARKADTTAAERQRRCRARKNGHAVTVTRDTPPNERDNLTPPCEEKPEPKGSVKKFILPADIPAEPWDGFEEMRKRIRKPMTDRSRALAVAELRRLRDEEGWPPGDVLNHCVMNSYQGIFPPTKARRNDIGKSASAYASLTAGLSPDEPF